MKRVAFGESLLKIPSEQKTVVLMSGWNARAVIRTRNFTVGFGEEGARGDLSQIQTE
jgi:hypothetical protein